MIGRFALAALGFMLCATAGASADPSVNWTVSPFAAMRTLQILQEQIAHGNGAAQAAQPKLMAHIAERFLAADPAVWREPRNARAAVLFVLSGGKPAVIRTVLKTASLPDGFDRLVKGALAYGEGNDASAREFLADIDPRGLPSVLGGHLALVQAALLSSQDNARAAKLLDLARLLVPGTLVEEAALRRQIFLLADPATFDKFAFLSREYIRRYRNSIYANNFKQRLTSVAIRLAMSGDVATLGKLDSILVELPAAEQLAFHLAIARVALVEGRAGAARMAAGKAADLAAEQSADEIRSKLYSGAAQIVSEDSRAGVRTLEAIDRSKLSPEDAELRDAAMAVAASVQSEVLQTGHEIGNGPAMAMPTDAPALATIELARSAVADTDRLLQGAQP